MGTRSPAVSVVVVAHAMERELSRTLRSLTTPYQREIERADFEVIVVDNGSPRPVASTLPADLLDAVRIHRIDAAAASPAHAANVGIALAANALVGLIIDGARLASPRLLAMARRAALLAPRAVVTAPAWHLGPVVQMDAEAAGYDQAAEDELLEQAGWEDDGYQLFTISTPAASSGRGLFGPMGESSSLFMDREVWGEVGGLDERFKLPGGGLVNHDLYGRACALDDAPLVVLLGEGTFHQIHGGAATSGRITRAAMRSDYEAVRGVPHAPPSKDPIFVGSVPRTYVPHIARSAAQVIGRAHE